MHYYRIPLMFKFIKNNINKFFTRLKIKSREREKTNNSTISNNMNRINEKNIQELILTIKTKKPIVFIGAGCSIGAGYPSWQSLIEELGDIALSFAIKGFEKKDISKFKDPLDVLRYTDKILNHFKNNKREDRYYNHIIDTFKPLESKQKISQLYRLLVNMRFGGYITTNYDILISEAMNQIYRISTYPNTYEIGKGGNTWNIDRFVGDLKTQNGERSVLHLHGTYKEPEKIVLGLYDYQIAYAKNSILLNAISNIFETNKVIFIGFSMNDPFVYEVLRKTSQIWKRDGSKTHYWITNLDIGDEGFFQERCRELTKFGFSGIFYNNKDGKHIELANMLERIYNELGETWATSIEVQEVDNSITMPTLPEEVLPAEDPMEELRRIHKRVNEEVENEGI